MRHLLRNHGGYSAMTKAKRVEIHVPVSTDKQSTAPAAPRVNGVGRAQATPS
jgi:hypothetical protein